MCLWEIRVREDGGGGAIGRRTGGRNGQQWLWFKVSLVTLLPGAVTASAQLSAGPGHLPENTPMHSCSSCGSPPLLGSSLLPAYYHALRPLLLAPTLTHSLTHLLRPGSDYRPIAGRRKGKHEKKGGGEIVWKTTALLPLVPIPGAQLWLGLQAFRQALTSCFLGCLWRDTEEV